MRFVKCRYYTESGEPVRGGCRRKDAGCAFIHPDDPDWNKARPSSSKPRESGDSGGFKSWGSGSNYSASSTAATSGSDAGDGWGSGGGWGSEGGWGSGGGWGTANGWGADDANTTPKASAVAESSIIKIKSRDTPSSASTWGHADSTASGHAKSTESARWGGSSDKATGSGWGGTGDSTSGWGNLNDTDNMGSAKGKGTENAWAGGSDKATGSGWGASDGTSGTSGWGNTRDADKDAGTAKGTGNGWGGSSDKATGSGWGGTGDGTSGTSGSGDAKNADNDGGSAWGSTQKNGWGDAGSTWGVASKDGWGSTSRDNKDTSDAMIVDKPVEKGTLQKAKRKTVPPPPRIRIPGNENREHKITGTNNVPLATNRWGGSRASSHSTVPALASISTPVTALTPTDSTRVKRKRDAVLDDKADVFKEYIKSWERGVRARFLLAEAEAKRDRWFRTQKSACYARIGEAGRKKLDGQRAECDREVTVQREKLSAAIMSLMEFHDTFSSNLELGQRYNVDEEVQRFVQESRGFVDETRALLVAQVLKDKNDARLDDRQKEPSETNSPSMDTLRSQFRDLEERLDQAQAELTLRRPHDNRSEIDELLTAKIANLRVARQREIDYAASQPCPEIVIPPAALMKIEETAQHVRELDAKVPQTVEDIRVLLLRVDATTRRVKELEEELSTSKETYKKMQCMVAEKEAVDRQAGQRLGEIQGQFEQLVASQPLGVSTPHASTPTDPDSRDKLMEILRPAFEATLEKFYEREVRPAVESMQRNAVDASDRLQAEAIQVLWGRIRPAMNMVAEVSRWLDSQELEHTAPVEEVRASGRSS